MQTIRFIYSTVYSQDDIILGITIKHVKYVCHNELQERDSLLYKNTLVSLLFLTEAGPLITFHIPADFEWAGWEEFPDFPPLSS